MKHYKTQLQGRFFHVARFLHFSDDKNEPGTIHEIYD